jgi:hypothetical protein
MPGRTYAVTLDGKRIDPQMQAIRDPARFVGDVPRFPSSAPVCLASRRVHKAMPHTAIAIDRIAGEAVRVQFFPNGNEGTAVFMIQLVREPSGKEYDADRKKVLLKAKSVAEHFIEYADKELLVTGS